MTAAMALAGCSANITRFDNPSFALGEGGGGTAPRRTAGGPILEPANGASPPPSTYAAQPRTKGVEVAGLPDPDNQPTPPAATSSGQQRALAVTRAPAPPAQQPMTAPVARGHQIEVQPGDTLYALSRRHKVMVTDLMAANGLANPTVRPGQKLYLPAGAAVRATPQVNPPVKTVARAAPLPAAPANPATPVPPSPPAASAGDTYTVAPGDSLYGIAARHKVRVGDLQTLNGITDATKVKPGVVLRLPAGAVGAPAQPVPPAPGETVQPDTRIVRVTPPMPPSTAATQGVRVLNGGEPRVASTEPVTVAPAPAAPAAAPAASAATPAQPGKLRWPVKGRIVQGFGPRADGTHNDGVDIAVPAGTDVLAAEGGVIAYAGNEVRTYGNLVLIRHDNGWVTAYAYNERLLVQRGDRVKRGQPIAKAGRTGAADQPALHFEVRVDSKPVDPASYLERL